MNRKKKRASREDIEQRIQKAAENGGEFDLDFDEVTDVIDLALERTKRTAEEAQEKAKKTIEDIRSISVPPAADNAK